jgi:hypothetical protein
MHFLYMFVIVMQAEIIKVHCARLEASDYANWKGNLSGPSPDQ